MFKYIFTFATQLGFYFALFSESASPRFTPLNTHVLPPEDVQSNTVTPLGDTPMSKIDRLTFKSKTWSLNMFNVV